MNSSDSIDSFKISPGEEALKEAFEKEKNIDGEYQQFSSFPTAFVVAADVELSVSRPPACASPESRSKVSCLVLRRHDQARKRRLGIVHLGEPCRRIRALCRLWISQLFQVQVPNQDGVHCHWLQVRHPLSISSTGESNLLTSLKDLCSGSADCWLGADSPASAA